MEDEEFYGLNIVEKFDDEAMAKHVYKDPVQLGVHIVLCRSLIKVFMNFITKKMKTLKILLHIIPFIMNRCLCQ